MSEHCLSSSRFIAFFDESGDHSLTKINPQLPIFVLCTVVVEREAYVRQIVPGMAALKLRYFAHEGVNLHSRDIRKAQGPFSVLQNAAVREQFMAELSALMADLPFTLFCTAIKKQDHAQRYGADARNPYNVALEYTFERVLHFMKLHGATELPVIAEGRGKKEDDDLRASFDRLMTQGTYYLNSQQFKKLICPLTFQRKQDNIAGLQLADLCAYPVARHVLDQAEPNQAFDVVRPQFYRDGNVYGLKVFPK